MNTTRLEIRRIEKRIEALEAEAAALLNREISASNGNKQGSFAQSASDDLKSRIFKAPPQVH